MVERLAARGADPLAGFAGEHINGTLMMRMQVRLRPAPWRNRDQMHTQPLRSGCLGRHTRKIVEVLLPGGWASPRLITTQTGSVLGCMSPPCGLVDRKS